MAVKPGVRRYLAIQVDKSKVADVMMTPPSLRGVSMITETITTISQWATSSDGCALRPYFPSFLKITLFFFFVLQNLSSRVMQISDNPGFHFRKETATAKRFICHAPTRHPFNHGSYYACNII